MAHSRHGTTRGVERRSAKLTQLRERVGKDLAIVAVDLAVGEQVAVVADHDSRVSGVERRAGAAGHRAVQRVRVVRHEPRPIRPASSRAPRPPMRSSC